MKKFIHLFVVAMLISGCGSYKFIRPVSEDAYIVNIMGSTPFYAMADLKADGFKKANEFAESQGKVAVVLDAKEKLYVPFVRNPSFELRFRAVDKDSSEARSGALVPSPYGAIRSDGRESYPDLHSELIKLNDLREKKILSEEEFQAQKKKMLEQ
jgi:hypothetical protein